MAGRRWILVAVCLVAGVSAVGLVFCRREADEAPVAETPLGDDVQDSGDGPAESWWKLTAIESRDLTFLIQQDLLRASEGIDLARRLSLDEPATHVADASAGLPEVQQAERLVAAIATAIRDREFALADAQERGAEREATGLSRELEALRGLSRKLEDRLPVWEGRALAAIRSEIELVAVAGHGKSIESGKPSAKPFVVAVRRRDGAPWDGESIPILWSVKEQGRGNFDPPLSRTNRFGRASASFTPSGPAGEVEVRAELGRRVGGPGPAVELSVHIRPPG